MTARQKVFSASEIPEGTGKEIVVGDRLLAVFNVGGQFHAIDGICPHAGGPLGKGKLTGCTVTCPWHGWQFDTTTGEHTLTPTIRQGCYTLEVEDGVVWLVG